MQFLSLCLILQASGLFFSSYVSALSCRVEKCTRVSKRENFGFNIAKRPLFIDTGECRTSFPSNISLSCFEQNNCLPQCVPRAYNLQLHSNRDGPLTVPVVKSCYATRHHCQEKCRRVPKIHYLFPDSKYQTRIDVGSCVGSCISNATINKCVATRMTSKSVEGPNGAVAVDIIQDCKCASQVCYRVDYLESYWDHSMCGNSTVRTEKLVNVGRCQGGCDGVFLPGRCYPSEDNCLLYIPGRPTKCVALTDRSDTYHDAALVEQTVHVVDKCGCGSA